MKVRELSRENLFNVLTARHYMVGKPINGNEVCLLGINEPYENADIEDYVEIIMDLKDDNYEIAKIRPFYEEFNMSEFNALLWWVKNTQCELDSEVTEEEKNNLLKN